MLKRLIYVFLLVILISALSHSVTAQNDSWLPPPSGPYQVGIRTYYWIDDARGEPFTANPDDKRELMVIVWYPADVEETATPEPYISLPDIDFSPTMTTPLMLPEFTFDLSGEDLLTTPTHSYRDAPLSNTMPMYPVLIFSHGWLARPEFFTAQIEELASHGYVVAAPVHTHITLFTIFPDQHFVIFSNPDFNLSVEIGAQDQSFVLDQLALLNDAPAGDPFSGRLELDRVGSFGHSWGAFVVALACLEDNRFAAAAPVDGSRIPVAVLRSGLDIPIMFMMREGRTAEDFLQNMRGPSYNLIFDGFGHNNFTDFTLYPNIASTDQEMIGDIDGPRAAKITQDYLVDFFDQYLKGEPSPLLTGPSPDFPEVSFEAQNLPDP